MELVKDIYFNTDKLVENTKIKVSYTGKFYQGNNEKVYLHYGYGQEWNNINEVEMSKTDLGYQAELNLLPAETLNFCFKNQNNEWDNNLGKNYIFNIEKPAQTKIIENAKPFAIFNQTNTENTEPEISNSFDTIIPFENKVDDNTANSVAKPQKDAQINNTSNIETSIALAPTGFGYWTKKIKRTVCNFFESLPKLISGNYKRELSDTPNKNNDL